METALPAVEGEFDAALEVRGAIARVKRPGATRRIATVEEVKIADIVSHMTMVGGNVVYEMRNWSE